MDIRESNPIEELLNKELIRQAILECLDSEDFEGIIEVAQAHLEAQSLVSSPINSSA